MSRYFSKWERGNSEKNFVSYLLSQAISTKQIRAPARCRTFIRSFSSNVTSPTTYSSLAFIPIRGRKRCTLLLRAGGASESDHRSQHPFARQPMETRSGAVYENAACATVISEQRSRTQVLARDFAQAEGTIFPSSKYSSSQESIQVGGGGEGGGR